MRVCEGAGETVRGRDLLEGEQERNKKSWRKVQDCFTDDNET